MPALLMRRALTSTLLLLAVLLTGCTSSDKDYVRNHIVLLPSPSTSVADPR